jgi:nucleotide-binding universal stress UspA family protein
MLIKKILAPTDFSESSQTGIRCALEIGRSQRAEVIVYHVIGYEQAGHERVDERFRPVAELLRERRELLVESLRENSADLLPDVQVRHEVAVGLPYRMILDKAEEEGADLIVMSTHGRTGLRHLLIGSVTEKVVRGATCPVLSVRPTKEGKLSKAAA